jgi:5-formyltetrahydrofolate cyclo-ligase
MTAHAGGASPPSAPERVQVRRQMRVRRRALSGSQRRIAAARFARIAHLSRLLRPGRRIAVYLAHDGEADPRLLIQAARRNGCELYLPAITDYRLHRMRFLRYDDTAQLQVNRYGIAEPDRRRARHIPVRCLDWILVPLAAVDARGTRIGSGAGFYDRCLQHLRCGRRWRRPKLIGLGYEFQRVAKLARQPWDVPLDALLTEQALYPLESSS